MTDAVHDVIIVGGGLAGAATAFFLSRERGLRVAVLEQEARPGVHSSGRNASLICRTSSSPEVAAWAQEGADFVADPPADFLGRTGFRRTGSFFLGAPAVLRARQRDGSERVEATEVERRFPGFRAAPGTAALFTPDDGVLDATAYLEGLLHSAVQRGVTWHRSARVRELKVEGERVTGVRWATHESSARVVVDAAGAWAGLLARQAGLDPPGLQPTRRHVLVTSALPDVDPLAPYAWDLERDFYFRPEQGGLLLCACDETEDAAGDCQTDARAEAEIRARAALCLPGLGGYSTRRLWAGHRTFAADGRFVLGALRPGSGLVYAAGLGGHGLTTAAAVGRIVAGAVLGELAASS